jgi:hypothetical protein
LLHKIIHELLILILITLFWQVAVVVEQITVTSNVAVVAALAVCALELYLLYLLELITP